MKVSKVVLAAMAVAITVSATTACKEKVVKPKTDAPAKKSAPDNCPACGMG